MGVLFPRGHSDTAERGQTEEPGASDAFMQGLNWSYCSVNADIIAQLIYY